MGVLTALRRRRVYLDTNVFVYALEAYSRFSAELAAFFAAIDRGELEAVTCELTLAELLVKPFRDYDMAGVRRCQEFVQGHSGLSVVPVELEVLIDAARVRAATGIRLPDAIHVAAACKAGCGAFLTNDQRLKSVFALDVLILSELVGNEPTG